MATLLDQYGRPIDMAALREEQAGPSMTGVRQVTSGHPAQGLTPARLASILLSAEQGDATAYLELAEEMEEKDPHYLSVLGTRKRQVSQLDIDVEPASDAANDVANADLVRAFIERDELQDELVDILDAVGKGYSATEILWDMSERQWFPTHLEHRDPRWFRFRQDDGRTLELLGEDGQGVPLTPYKFIEHRHKAKSGLPIRGGLARPIAWWYLFKNYGVKDWIAFIEIYGQPLRIGKYHAGATTDQKSTLLRALGSLGTDAAAMIPDGMMIEFVESQGARAHAEIYERLIRYIDGLTSKAVLGQTLTTEVGDSGSRALGDVHDGVRADIETSDCKQLMAVLGRDLVRPIVDLNRGPQKTYPRIHIGRPEPIDVVRMADSLAKLVPLGFKVSQRQVAEMMGLDQPAAGDELLGPPSAPAAAPPPPDPAAGGLPAVDPKEKPKGADAPARAAREAGDDAGPTPDVPLAERMGRAAQPAVTSMLGSIEAMLGQAESLDHFRALLLAAWPDLGTADLAQALAAGLAAAGAAGRFDVAGDG